MVTKGIITEIINKYQARVRIPIYNKAEESPTATPNEELSIGPVNTLPGISPNISVGDVVIIAFEQDIYTDPVILGLLYTENSSRGFSDIQAGELSVVSEATLPSKTTIGDVTGDQIYSLKDIKGNVQNQLDLLSDKLSEITESSVYDVKVAGTSVVTDGIANIPYASTSQAGVVSTAAQIFSGQKTFNGITVFNSKIYLYDNGSAIALENESSSTNTKLTINQDSPSGVIRDFFYLPTTNNSDTSGTYNIITTKNLTDIGTIPVTQGGTGATTFTSGALLTGNGTGAINAYTPAWQAWTAGTTAGPKAKIKLGNVNYESAAIPSASASASGIITTGNQTFAGRKTLDLISPSIYDGTANTSRYKHLYYKNNAGTLVGDARYDSGNATNVSGGRFSFIQYSPNSTASTTTTGSAELYHLPIVTSGLAGNVEYNILTDKNVITIAQGGTGQTTSANAINNLLQDGCSAGTSNPVDGDTYIASYADGKNSSGTGTNTFHRRPVEKLWNYINGKASSVYAAKSHTHDYAGSSSAGGNATKANALVVIDERAAAMTIDKSKTLESFFSNNGMPDSKWWAGVHITGWTGAYSSWELVGPAHNTDQRTTPIYLRSSNTNSSWGSWRQIYDSSNPPTYSAVGAAAASHTHAAGDITSGSLAVARGGTGASTAAAARGNLGAMGAISANGYYGMAGPDGTASDWIRTTTLGLIPYQSGGSGSGHCGLGTSSWYFSYAYIDSIYTTSGAAGFKCRNISYGSGDPSGGSSGDIYIKFV